MINYFCSLKESFLFSQERKNFYTLIRIAIISQRQNVVNDLQGVWSRNAELIRDLFLALPSYLFLAYLPGLLRLIKRGTFPSYYYLKVLSIL